MISSRLPPNKRVATDGRKQRAPSSTSCEPDQVKAMRERQYTLDFVGLYCGNTICFSVICSVWLLPGYFYGSGS